MYGWIGRSLRVNLTENDFTIEETPSEFTEIFLGGRGLGVKVLSDEIEPGIDPPIH